MTARIYSLLFLVSVTTLPAIAPLYGSESEYSESEYSESERSHWSLSPRIRPQVPEVDAKQWVQTSVDYFILQGIEAAGLKPSPRADRRTLIRRLTFDLTGLPPTPDQVSAFLLDDAPDAYQQLVDRLLASPAYGEQWGQYWLDVVRYAETEGFEYDRHRPGAWRYRDYVVSAFNSDKPFDRFTIEQLAGDELEGGNELLIAAGFHRLGPVRRNAGNAAVAFSRNEVLTERTNIVGSAFLGLTIGCARCHDHMFDPIRQRDYYHLQAFFAASFEHDHTLASEQEQRDWEAATDVVNKQIKAIKNELKTAEGDRQARLREQLAETEARLPKSLPTISTVRNEHAKRTQVHLLKRGDPSSPADQLAPRPLGVLLPEGAPELAADLERPKAHLARWIASSENPLTARVIANRLWQYHFGAGLVATSNDFGLNGDVPSHPELLDHLANELIQSGWQLKRIHRLLVSSSVYQQASAFAESEADPENRLFARFRRRRMAAHEIRDALLAVSGSLDQRIGGPSVMVPVDPELVGLLYKPSQWSVAGRLADQHRRSVYLISKRNLRLPFMEVFDQPDLQTSCFRRESSTHAPQALELLNGAFTNALAIKFAERIQAEAGTDRSAQVRRAFQLACGRPPTTDEERVSVRFLSTQPLSEFALAVFNLNAFLYVD